MLLGSQDWQRFSPSFRFIPCRDTLRHASCRILLASPPLQAPPLFRRSPRACLFLLAWLKCPEPSTQTPNPVPSVSPGRSALASSASFASAGSTRGGLASCARPDAIELPSREHPRVPDRCDFSKHVFESGYSFSAIHHSPILLRSCVYMVRACLRDECVCACVYCAAVCSI